MVYHLAIDIGASSGRHILGFVNNGKLELEEIYRFDNGFENSDGSFVWNIEHLKKEVLNGIKKCKELGKIPATIAIDTWAVDYVLLDENRKELSPAYCYRDSRTYKVIPKVEAILSQEELYHKTGIQKLFYNTIYQLCAEAETGRLLKARYFLMIPAYLSYYLTGVIKNEYTNCSTTALVSPVTKDWDDEILKMLGIPKDLLGKISLPGEEVGSFRKEIEEEAGFNSTVIFCPSHDTAAAVAASPITGNDLYISSGTWSLAGIESKEAIITDRSCEHNFSNEGGIDYRFRFLKNYMGMWLFQNIRKNLNKSLTYDEMMNLAKSCGEFRDIDVNSPMFTAPENMIDAIREYLREPDLPLPVVLNSVYHSLAKSYGSAIAEIEEITGKKIEKIHIIGGGSKDTYLNELTAKYTKRPVTAGPVEATAIGNLGAQFIYSGECKDIDDFRKTVIQSFNIEEVVK